MPSTESSGTADAAPQVARNVEQLGFKLTDIKLMLASHEHLDHVGGAAELKRRTGARLMVLPGAGAWSKPGQEEAAAPLVAAPVHVLNGVRPVAPLPVRAKPPPKGRIWRWCPAR